MTLNEAETRHQLIDQQLDDTAPKADAVLLALLRQTPVWRKLQLMEQINAMTQTLALSGLRRQYPHTAEPQLRRLLADRILGRELADRVYGPISDEEERNAICGNCRACLSLGGFFVDE
ncbi:MAG: hypothetical protein IAE79_27180 [Anaerolinea sp.]|nr:hypothetical protein [Anaerolinea sp.]